MQVIICMIIKTPYVKFLLIGMLFNQSLAGAETSQYKFSSDEWPALLEIQKHVPGFAGIGGSCEEGLAVALVFPNLVDQAKKVISSNKDFKSFQLCEKAINVTYSVKTLINAAQAYRKVFPDSIVTVDTGLNRVVVESSGNFKQAPAEIKKFIVDSKEQPSYRILFSTVKSDGYINPVVSIENRMGRPISIKEFCAGNALLKVYQADRPLKTEETVCTSGEVEIIVEAYSKKELKTFVDMPLYNLLPGIYQLRLETDFKTHTFRFLR